MTAASSLPLFLLPDPSPALLDPQPLVPMLLVKGELEQDVAGENLALSAVVQPFFLATGLDRTLFAPKGHLDDGATLTSLGFTKFTLGTQDSASGFDHALLLYE